MPLPPFAPTARPDHVLVCSDGSPAMQAATSGGAIIAERVGAGLRLVYVQEADDSRGDQERADAVNARAAELGATPEILRPVAGDGFDVAATLARHIDEVPNAVVVVSTHGRGAIGQSIFGSVTADLVRARRRPFLVFGPHAAVPERFGRVLVCTDGSDLSEAILPAATALARDLDLPLWVVEVLVPARAPTGRDLAESATVQRVAGRVAELAGGGDVAVEWEVLYGEHAGPAIAEYADAEAGTITALATHGRSGLAGKLVGSVAQEVTRRAAGPVLLLHPEPAGQR